MPSASVGPVPLSVFLAVLGYFLSSLNDKRSEQRKARISRVNDQVKLFYGPLMSCVAATKSAYAAMVSQHSPDGTLHGFNSEVKTNPEGQVAKIYRNWMKEVFMPLNIKAAQLIIDHADLMDGGSMEPMLMQLVAHVSAYRVLLRNWDEGHFEDASVLKFPDEIHGWITFHYERMKGIQMRLLRIPRKIEGAPGIASKL